MRKIILILMTLLFIKANAQNPGLVISEIHPNPAGTDSCKEYVELLATQNINFATTPYCVIVNNNGTAIANGWIAGGGLTYAFEINTGTITQGSIVHVGGSCMTPTLNQIRVINVKNVGGDGGIGLANTSGVFGNGGGNADGVAVFNLPVASITSSSVPVDAVFFGTGIGTATVIAPGGYQLPVNDLYNGGKLSTTSFFATEPGGDILTAIGAYNISTNNWGLNRTFSITPIANITSVSSVSLTTASSPASISFFASDTTVLESVSSATVYARLTSTSSAACSFSVGASLLSNASVSDYTLATTTISFAANAPINSLAPIVININDDALIESSEYIVLRLTNGVNANLVTNTLCAVYIKDNDKVIPQPSNALGLNLLASFSNSITGANSAEIVAHDPTTQRLYIANSIGGKIDIVNFINPSAPVLISSINTASIGGLNSVAVRNGTVVCAFENAINPQDSGKVVFLDKDGVFLKDVKVGPIPDMITFNNAGTKVLTANEAEPNAAYTQDPDGSVSIIDISGGVSTLNQSNVTAITFTAYNGTEATLRAQGIRIFGVSGVASKDFEPEYIAISKDDTKAWVTLQENNAIVEINLVTNSITSLRAMGTKDHSLLNNGMDASNTTKDVNIANFPVKGFYMPDAIASYTVGGVNYYVTANEGDARAYTGLNEESRVSALNLDPIKFPYAAELKNNALLGRLLSTNKSGDTDNDGDIDSIYCYGSRSFSIWNGATGNLVYDSKDDMEQITASNSFSVMFNASNTSATRKDRSDDKGPEPEGVAIGVIGGNTYAFIAIERIGGVMVYDITNPNNPVYVTYVNNRSLLTNGPDRGAEGIIFIPQSQSPNGQHIVIAANEVSSTLSIWGIAGCTTPLTSSISVSGSTVACSANSPTIAAAVNVGASYQWYNNGALLVGATSNTIIPTVSGNYSVSISSGTNCSTSSLQQSVTVNASPTITVNSGAICIGNSFTITPSGATTYTYSSGSNVVSPTVNASYNVIGTSAQGCVSSNTAVSSVTVNTNPTITVNSGTLCSGSSFTIIPSGANTYTYSSGSNVVSPTVNASYNVIGTSAQGCVSSNTAVSSVTVNASPTITVNSGTLCSGNSFTITPSGANTYTYSSGSNVVSPTVNSSYTVIGKDVQGCISSNTAVSSVTVNASPTITVNSGAICIGNSFTITPSGANTYTYSGGSSVVSPTVNSSYTITGTNAQGCVSSNTAISSVTVNANPTITVNSGTICSGNSFTITPSGATTYTYSGGSNVVSPTVNASYTITGANAQGCVSSNTAISSVTVNANPTITVNSGTICSGNSFTITPSGATTYTYSGGSNVVSPTVNASYSVIGTNTQGCVSSNTAVSSVTVNTTPTVNVSSSSNTICVGQSASLTASGANSYTWNTTSTLITIVVSPTITTTYTVNGSNANGCIDLNNAFTLNVSPCTSVIEETNELNNLVVYPNPNNGTFKIKGIENNITSIKLFNAIGEIIFEEESFSNTNELSFNNIAKGIYFVAVTSKVTHVSTLKKVIIE